MSTAMKLYRRKTGQFQGWTNLFLHARIFGHAISLARGIGFAIKNPGAQYTKIHVRSRNNKKYRFLFFIT